MTLAVDSASDAPKDWDSYWVEVDSNGSPYYWNHRDDATAWELPDGTKPMWKAMRSQSKGGTYYVNQLTDESTWQVHYVDAKEACMKKASKEAMRRAFDRWDAEGSGSLSWKELGKVLIGLGLTDEEARRTFSAADINKDGEVDWGDFKQYMAGVAGEPPLALHYMVHPLIWLTVTRENGETIANLSVDPDDKFVNVVDIVKKTWRYADQCKYFTTRYGELTPMNKTFKDFGARDGDRIKAVALPKDSIQEYFKVLRTLFEEDFRFLMERNPRHGIAQAYDAGDLIAFESRKFDERVCEKDIQPLMENVFIQFDTMRDGALREEEAQVFFKIYFSLCCDFAEWATDLVTKIVRECIADGCLDTGACLSYEQQQAKAKYEKELNKKIDRMPGEVMKYVEGLRREYHYMEFSWNSCAFTLLDINQALRKELKWKELASALMPNSKKHLPFRDALRVKSFAKIWEHVLLRPDLVDMVVNAKYSDSREQQSRVGSKQ